MLRQRKFLRVLAAGGSEVAPLAGSLWSIDAAIGFAGGVQNGVTARIGMSDASLIAIGVPRITTTIKTLVDLLLTLQTRPVNASGVFAKLKGGAGSLPVAALSMTNHSLPPKCRQVLAAR